MIPRVGGSSPLGHPKIFGLSQWKLWEVFSFQQLRIQAVTSSKQLRHFPVSREISGTSYKLPIFFLLFGPLSTVFTTGNRRNHVIQIQFVEMKKPRVGAPGFSKFALIRV